MSWVKRNFKSIIYFSFLVPIILVALVSISHVTNWYGVTNPSSWSIYLSVAVEIAALAALAAISAEMGSKVYFPFAIVTIIQFIGNIFYSYTYIDVNSKEFKDWVDLIGPIVESLNIDKTDIVGQKRFLAMLSGGMLPLISLSFLHMLVKFRSNTQVSSETTLTKPVVVHTPTPTEPEPTPQPTPTEPEPTPQPTPTEPEPTPQPTPTEPEPTPQPTPTEPEPTPQPTPTSTEYPQIIDDLASDSDLIQDIEVSNDDPTIPKIKRLSYTRRNG